MKRITFVAVVALFSAVASTGCLGQTGSGEGTDESDQTSDRAYDLTPGDEEANAKYVAAPSHALELKTHSTDDSQGPHPEPWLDQAGPHPEPWTGKIAEPDPTAGNSGTPPKP